jgi:hypothetical protein
MKIFSNTTKFFPILPNNRFFLFAIMFFLFLFLVFPVFAENELDQTKIIDWQINDRGLEIKIMAPKNTSSLIYINGSYEGRAEIIDFNNKYNLLLFNYDKFEKSEKYILEIISQDENNKFIGKDLIEFNYFANIKENNLEAPELLSIKKDTGYIIIDGFSQDVSNTYFYLDQKLIKNIIITKRNEARDGAFTIKIEHNQNKDVCVYAYLKKEVRLSSKSNLLCYKEDTFNTNKNEKKMKNNSFLEEIPKSSEKNKAFINIISPKDNSNINKPEIEIIINSENCNEVSLYIDNVLRKTKEIINSTIKETIFKNNSLSSGKHNIYAKCTNNDLNIDKKTEIIEINLFKPEISISAKENSTIKEVDNENNNSLNKSGETKNFLTNNEKFIFLIFIIAVLTWLFWNNKNIVEKK